MARDNHGWCADRAPQLDNRVRRHGLSHRGPTMTETTTMDGAIRHGFIGPANGAWGHGRGGAALVLAPRRP
jgi:hypothetical protein